MCDWCIRRRALWAVAHIMWTLETNGQLEKRVLSYTAGHGERMGAHVAGPSKQL